MTNPDDFYEELLKTFEDSYKAFNKTLIVDMYFEYINTSSTKWLLNTLTSLDSLVNGHGLIEVNWYYEEDDETIRETGEIFQASVNLPMHLWEI